MTRQTSQGFLFLLGRHAGLSLKHQDQARPAPACSRSGSAAFPAAGGSAPPPPAQLRGAKTPTVGGCPPKLWPPFPSVPSQHWKPTFDSPLPGESQYRGISATARHAPAAAWADPAGSRAPRTHSPGLCQTRLTSDGRHDSALNPVWRKEGE